MATSSAPWKQADTAANPQSPVRPGQIPRPSASKLGYFPGCSTETADAASGLLTYNHETFHVFFNEKGFHNHLAHHVLAAISIGAPPSQIDEIYRHSLQYLDPKFKYNKKPNEGDARIIPIDRSNWTTRLRKIDHYWSYLEFYQSEIKRLGPVDTIKEYVFSRDANAPGVEMLDRFVSGAVHPLIHSGYGVEFELDGVLAEGLAMTSITRNQFGALRLRGSGATKASPTGTLRLVDVLSEMDADPELAPGKAVTFDSDEKNSTTMASPLADKVASYADNWRLEDWEVCLQELSWIVMLLLGATTRPGFKLRHNFFLMHAHNAILFLHTLLPLLTLEQRRVLLDAFLRMTLTYWIATGRARFYISDRLMTSPLKLDKQQASWEKVFEIAAVHSDEHFVKAVRTLGWLANKYPTPPSELSSKSEKDCFVGLQSLDGTAFLRTALQLVETQGFQGDGENNWDYAGVGFDEAYSQ